MDKRNVARILILGLTLLLAACLNTGPTPTPVVTNTLEPAITPTNTPVPTTTPTQTAAPTTTQTTAPTPTQTTPPTATETAAPTATATAAAQPTRVVEPPEPIQLPAGLGISIFAEGLSNPRMMALGPDGAIYVAERGRGRIVRLPDRDGDGVADGIEVVADGLNAPSSLAFYQDGSLYVGETARVLRLSSPNADGVWQERQVIVSDLPTAGGGHSTRTVLFSPDWQWLYVSVGSSCNVCVEQDPRRAAILRYTPQGGDETIHVSGMRNAVGIAFRPGTNELWATNNGRDWLGDDVPPETVYRVEQGDDAGWPYCHAGQIIDPDFGQTGSCDGILDPAVEMQAHTAPLGLTFYTGDQFPQYQGDLIVALHGSWNRSVPVGYKVVRVAIENGNVGEVTDLASGWLRENGRQWGRPVDVLTGSEGSLFVSDDGQGRIYRIFAASD